MNANKLIVAGLLGSVVAFLLGWIIWGNLLAGIMGDYSGTASGVTFVTLEDDTGNINVVVWSATARAQKQPYLTAKILQVQGFLERKDQVIHVIAGRLTDLSDELTGLHSKSRDFH